jgi:predicted nucleic acid-binding protein
MEGSDEIGIPLVALIETAHVLRTQYDVATTDILALFVELLTRQNIATLGLPTSDVVAALIGARSLPGNPIPDAFVSATAKWAAALPLYTFDEQMHRHGVAVAVP